MTDVHVILQRSAFLPLLTIVRTWLSAVSGALDADARKAMEGLLSQDGVLRDDPELMARLQQE